MSFFIINSYRYKKLQDVFGEYVSLLLRGDGTNGAQNNTFLDSSTNTFTITRNGTPTQGSFSPYGNSWSNYFDGSGDYLSFSGITFNGDFCAEAWVFRLQNSSSYSVIFGGSGVGPPGSANNHQFHINNNGGVSMVLAGYGVIDGSLTTGSVLNNQWNHIAWVRNGSNCAIFVNGVRQGTATFSINTSVCSRIASITTGSSAYSLNGYISNARIVIGNSVYDPSQTIISVPTSPLTAVAGTSLLTCQSNRFVDNSSNNFTITANGTPSVQPNSPFTPTSEYSITANGGSGYFNGTTDYLTIPDSEQFNLAANNFTIECWAYFNSSVDQYYFGQIQSAGSNRSFCHAVIGGKYYFEVRSGSTAYSITSVNNITLNEWTHLAAVRNGNTITLYRNGVSIGSVSVTGVTVNNSTLLVGIGGAGSYSAAPLNGYISNARLVNGTAVYTSNFTPPTSPLTAVANTSLLCNFTNAGIFDNAAKNNLLTVGTARISTAEKKYGSGSMLFNGSTDYCRAIAPVGTHQFGTGDFTIECWAYCTNLAGGTTGAMEIIDFRSSTINEARPTLAIQNSQFLYYANGSNRIVSGTISANTWYHVAVVRSSGSTKLYVNGTNVGVTYSDTTNYLDSNPTIANWFPNPIYGFAGYIDDVRITKGIAHYTANFTPPGALPAQ